MRIAILDLPEARRRLALTRLLTIGRASGREPADIEGGDRRRRRPVQDELAQHGTHHGAELEAVAGEAEGVEEARRRPARADDRDVVGHDALDAGPGADDLRMAQARHQCDRLAARIEAGRGDGVGAQPLAVGNAASAAEDDVAARDLPDIEPAAADAEIRHHEIGHAAR